MPLKNGAPKSKPSAEKPRRPQVGRMDETYIKACDDWFPKGRNPWRDLYTPERMKLIAAHLGLSDELQLFSLERRLCNVAEHYLTLQQDTVLYSDARPLGVTYGDRAQWLDENILTPARLLDKALNLENQPYLSLFPNLETDEFPRHPPFSDCPLRFQCSLTGFQHSTKNFRILLRNLSSLDPLSNL